MRTLVALLRAVNVGGTGRLPMAELRALCEAIGFARVRTYIQSGNVVFATDGAPAAAKAALEAGLRSRVGKPVGVVLRTAPELRDVLARNPFPAAEPARVAVIFLDDAPPADVATAARGRSDEEIVGGEREVFVHYPSGMGRSRLKLGVMDAGTARNLNTVARLAEMASS